MTEKYKVYCCTHVNTQCFNDPLYTLLHTGKAYDGKDFKIQGDDTGDNISCYKDIFDGLCTGLYWVWKNTNHEYTGLCSYRGYLSYDGKAPVGLKDAKELFEVRQVDFIASRCEWPLSEREMLKKYWSSLFYHNLHDPYEYLREAIGRVAPGYLKAFDYAYNRNLLNTRHTFITRRPLLEDYCEWVFTVIEEFRKVLIEKHYEILRNRFFGWFIELLERVWLINNSINVLELPLAFVTEQNSGYAG